MSRTSRWSFLALLLLPVTAVFAQEAPQIDQAAALRKISQEIDAKRKQYFVPGAAVAIIKDDKVVLLEGLGYRDAKKKVPVTADTLFAVGSTSKAFTAMLMAMAVDEGKVKFSDSPKKYLPYFRMHDPETDAKITIGDLLSHRSGLPRTDLIMVAGDLSSEDLIWSVTRAKPTAKLGEKFQYQNIMFVAAGEVEKKIYGKTWDELIDERIFTPLGMSRSNTSVPETLKDADHSLGYDGSPAMKELPMRAIPSAAPAGAINSSAREMAEWIRFMLRKGQVDGKALVSKESYEELLKPRQTIAGTSKYGYGWMLRDWNGHQVVEHGGNIDGFNAQVAMMPEKNLGMVILTNVSGSPLGGAAMESTWKNLVGEPAGAEKIVALQEPEKEVGSYYNDQIKMEFVITHEGSKLFVKPTGQPKMEMLPLGNRKYKLAPPAPEKVYVSLAPDKEDAKLTNVTLEQSGMTFVFKPMKPYEAPIKVDELMSKVVAAMGGEANMSKLKTMSYHYTFDMESQGLKATGVVNQAAPNLMSDLSVLTAAGRRIGWVHSYFNGVKAADEVSFGPTEEKSGVALVDARIAATMFQELNWKSNFPTVTITGVEKVEGEEAYVVQKNPKVGSKVVDYVSKDSFRLLKRVSGAGAATVTDIYKDYKDVEGVQIPMRIIRETVLTGKGTMTVSDLVVNGPVDKALVSKK